MASTSEYDDWTNVANGNVSISQCEYYEYIFHEVLWLTIPMTIILVLLFICGIIENICVLIVITLNKSMHSTTNFYLFSLAISDLLYITCYPIVLISVLWCSPHYPNFCLPCNKLTYLWYTHDVGMDSSSLIVTLFTIERFMAICYGKNLSSQKRIVLSLIGAIWILTVVVNLSFYLNKKSYGTTGTYICFLFMYYLIFYIIPFVLIAILCILMIRNIKKSLRTVSVPQEDSSTDRAFNILVAIVITFFICWIPTYAFLLIDKYGLHPSRIREYVNLLITTLACLPAVINPILYSVMSPKFRQAYKDTFARLTGKSRSPHQKSEMSLETMSEVKSCAPENNQPKTMQATNAEI